MTREDRAFGIALLSVALAFAASAAAAIQLSLIFHFHPAVIAAAAGYVLRRLLGQPASVARVILFLAILVTLTASYDAVLEPRGLGDGPFLTAVIAAPGFLIGAVLARRGGGSDTLVRAQ